MGNVQAIFKELGGPGKVAGMLGVRPSAASEMKRRKSIPVRYWPDLVRICDERGIEGINYATLVKIHSERDAQ